MLSDSDFTYIPVNPSQRPMSYDAWLASLPMSAYCSHNEAVDWMRKRVAELTRKPKEKSK